MSNGHKETENPSPVEDISVFKVKVPCLMIFPRIQIYVGPYSLMRTANINNFAQRTENF